MKKIAVDENIIFAKDAFEKIGEPVLFNGRTISNNQLKDFDALIIRSITKVNEELLDGTNIKFIGTATIGTDHVDKEYLNKKDIRFEDAKGCNSYAVAEYVITGIIKGALLKGVEVKQSSIGIIGAGNIGKIVEQYCEALGMTVKLNDPPLKEKTGDSKYRDLDEILNCDFITMHVPLETRGRFPTFHLISGNEIKKTKKDCVIINSSRGEVIDSSSIMEIEKENRLYFFDVWENEPKVNKAILDSADIASPHIAGYTIEGKINGTLIMFNKLKEFFNLSINYEPPKEEIETIRIFEEGLSDEKFLEKIFDHIYKHSDDTELMKKMLSMETEEGKKYFDLLRKEYKIRKEFKRFKIEKAEEYSRLNSVLETLRFTV